MNNSRLLILKAEKNRRTKKTGWFVLHLDHIIVKTKSRQKKKKKNETFKRIE